MKNHTNGLTFASLFCLHTAEGLKEIIAMFPLTTAANVGICQALCVKKAHEKQKCTYQLVYTVLCVWGGRVALTLALISVSVSCCL